MRTDPTIVIGAGPSGLSAAHTLCRNGITPLVLEADSIVGGISRTVEYGGHYFDIGGHRFFTKIEAINALWKTMLDGDFKQVQRLSRIYYNERFFAYPLKIGNALKNLGLTEGFRIAGSYARAQVFSNSQEETFEQWMTNRFGQRLFAIFFKSYTEKVWGRPCSEIRADWAAQRIKGLSLVGVLANALFGQQKSKTLTDHFFYPPRGPGMMWQKFQDAITRAGGAVRMKVPVVEISHTAGRIESLKIRREDGAEEILQVAQVISSMPIGDLVGCLSPAPPEDVRAAAEKLTYRDFVMVGLILKREELFPDQWIYVHDPNLQVGRIQNFRNWSRDMSPIGGQTNIGMEYFCNQNDRLWRMTDNALIDLAASELAHLGLARREDVLDGFVVRQKKAYPVYDAHYRENLDRIQAYLGEFENLQTIGRNGMHRYNNMDHAMQTGIFAAQNVLGGTHDLWTVNDEAQYLESSAIEEASRQGDMEIVGRIFNRLDPLALGMALGMVCGVGLCLATLWLVIKGGASVGPTLQLMGQYFIGYTVSPMGAGIGLLYGIGCGFACGWGFATLRNFLLRFYLFRMRNRLARDQARDMIDRF